MKKNSLFVSIVSIGFFMLIGNPVPAQGLEWGVIGGPLLTKPVTKIGYSVSGLISEEEEDQVNPFYAVFVKKRLRKRWHADAQLGFSKYSYGTKSDYEDTQFVQYSESVNKYSFVEFVVNNHFVLLEGKHGLSAFGGLGLASVTRSTYTLVQYLDTQDVISATFDFEDKEDNLHFFYQVGLQYMYSFESFALLVRPFYKRFTEEQYVIPEKQLSAFGLGIGVQF